MDLVVNKVRGQSRLGPGEPMKEGCRGGRQKRGGIVVGSENWFRPLETAG